MSETIKKAEHFFDGIPLSKKQKHFLFFLACGTMIEQIDLYKFSFIAPALMKVWNLDMSHIGKINAFFAIGSAIGAIAFGWLSDHKGRRNGMSIAMIVGGTGALLSAVAPNYTFLLYSRLLAGFGITGALILEAPYLAEMVSSTRLSRYQGTIGFFSMLGVPISAAIATSIMGLGLDHWRYVAAIPGIALPLGILFRIMVPESPRWLIQQGRDHEAQEIFTRITGYELVIDDSIRCVDQKVTLRECFSVMFHKYYLKRTIVLFGIGIVLFNVGFMINQWMPTFLVQEGLDMTSSLKIQQILTVTGIFAPIYIMLFGDKGGRKWPYAIALFALGVSVVAIALNPHNISGLAISVGLFGLFYATNQQFCAVSLGMCYPTRVKSMIVAISGFCQKVCNTFVHAMLVPFLYGALGFQKYFLVLSVFYFIFAGLVLWLLPKTTGISIEELSPELSILQRDCETESIPS